MNSIFLSAAPRSVYLRHTITFLVAVAAVGLAVGAPILRADEKPNVVIFLSDDQGWGDLSLHGNRNINTPNIDSLARDGALFERLFVCPVCSPTRAEFLTGRYHPRSGVYSTSTGGERLDLDEKTIADTFKQGGYATAAFGKWHNGTQYPYHPNARGFDEFYGFCSGHWGNYFSPQLEHNGELVQGDGYLIDDLTDHALEFVTKNQGQPFFCYLPYNTPHSPMQVPDRFYERFANADVKMRNRDPKKENILMTRAALAMCENIDWNVGRVLRKLDELGLAENTIVVYFADNGPNSSRWNGDMKGRKGSTDEGGVRVPCVVRWPRQISAGTSVPQISAAIDLLPTLADMTGIPIVGDKPLDGISLKPLLLGSNATPWPDRRIFSHWRGRVSVRTQRFRLDHRGQLFDMVKDPGQRVNVSKQHNDVTSVLSAEVEHWKNELLPGLTDDNRPFPIGYRQFPTTLLPARDGVPTGNVRRSNRFPNCTYYMDWKSVDDRVTWDVEVANSGRYDVVLHYACPGADVGATFELTFNGQRIEGRISQAHEPPLVGPEHDRVPRAEGPVKAFRPMTVGTMELEKGRGPLTMRALEIPGSQLAEIRYVVLTLKDD